MSFAAPSSIGRSCRRRCGGLRLNWPGSTVCIRVSVAALGKALQQTFEFLHWQRPTEKVALKRMAAETSEEFPLFFRFHALGNNRQARRVTKGNNSLCNGAAAGIHHYVPHKRSIDLQLAQRQIGRAHV